MPPREPRRLAVATLGYAVLTFIMAYPFSASPASLVLDDAPDMHLFIWTLLWDAHAFVRQPLGIFDANIYYPFANTLAYSENLIGTAFLAAPIIWLTGDGVLATNLATLLSTVLCGTGAYLLARRWNLSPAGAFVCGLVFAFAPARFSRISQLHLTAMQWIPFTLAFLHSYFERGRRRDLLLALGAFSLQALSSGHGAVFLLIAIGVLVAWRLAFGQPFTPVRWLRDCGAAGAYLLAPAVWVTLPYRMAQTEAGLRREYPAESMPGLASFLASPSHLHMALQEWWFGRPVNDEAVAYLFPGLLAPVLAVAALWLWRPQTRDDWRREAPGYFLVLGVLSTLMFVRGPLDLWQHLYALPGFNFIRVPSRFMVLVTLCLAMLAAAAFDRLTGRLPRRGRAAAAVVLCGLLLVEYGSQPLQGVPYRVEIPAIDRWLDTQPKPFVVAEVPVPSRGDLGRYERHHTTAMLHATAHWQKTVHGYSGIRRPFHDRLYQDMARFPDAQSLASMREAGVTHVVVHTEGFPGETWREVEAHIDATEALEFLHAEGTGRVYRLRRR